MRPFLLSVLISILFLSKTFGQTPTIAIDTQTMPGRACVDAPFRLPVIISGRFEVGNQFKVQVRPNVTGVVVAEIPATLVGNALEFKFTNAQLYEYPNVQMRIITSAPKTETPWLENAFLVYSKGNVTLSQAALSDSVNLYDDYRVRISGSSTTFGWATLNDSSRIQIISTGKFDFVKDVVVVQDGPLTIAHAENECGAMQISGILKPVVNKTSIKTLSVDPQVVCEGAEMKIGYSLSGPALPAQTQYRVRFSHVNSSDTKSVDVAAQLKDGFLIARFPENFNIEDAQQFVAQVVTDNAVASQSNQFLARTKPSAAFSSPSQTIKIGDFTGININLTGLSPFTITLSDGTTETFPTQGTVQINLGPDKTTSYTIKSMTSGCGNAASIANSVLQIKVDPGIMFAHLAKKQSFCPGSKASIKFVSNVEFTNATQFWIELADAPNDANKVRIPVTRSGDQLLFDVPNRQRNMYGTSSKIITANPVMESPVAWLIDIQAMPTIELADNMYDYKTPTNVNFTYFARGGGPFIVEMPEGEKIDLDDDGTFIYSFFLKQNREFKIKSISNSCFKNENLTAINYRITGTGNEPVITMEPLKSPICSGDSLEVTFQKFGNFNAGNQFQIQVTSDCCDAKTLATVSDAGKYKVKVSASSFTNGAIVRVASTSPVMFSEIRTFGIQLLPENNRISIEGTKENPYESPPNFYFENLGVPAEKGVASRVEYTENGENKVYLNTNDQGLAIPIKMLAGKVNEYVIKSVSNVCGTVPLDLKTYIYAVPYRIIIVSTEYEGRNYCIGGPISIPFGVADAMSKPATFSLQIAKAGESLVFNTIASTETGRILSGKIPDGIETGPYILRVLSSDGVTSEMQTIQIGTVPTAQLGSGADSEPLVIEPGANTNIKVSLTGGPFWWIVVYEDNSRFAYSKSEEVRSFNPLKGGKFFIKSVSNFCGYGTASGSVSAKVNPGLQAGAGPMNVCEGGTVPITYALVGDVDISDDYIRFELVDLATNVGRVLDSTRTLSGTRLVKLPETFPDNRFIIRVVVKKYTLSATLSLGFTRKPRAILSGNTTINSGESAYIIAQHITDNYEAAEVTLSDGTKGYINGASGEYSYIGVSPKQTTTYTITSIKNGCSTGVGSGSAIVEVNPVSARSISVTNVFTPQVEGICAGSEISVQYTLQGTFTTGNKFTVQISDSTGRNFTDLQTTGTTSPLKAIVPLTMPDGRRYRIRVTASDAGTSSSAYREAYTVAKKSKARFSTESVLFDGTTAPRVQVLLEGGAPWTFRYGTDLGVQTVQTKKPVYDIELLNASVGQIYKIFGVSNACGNGDIGTPGTVRVEVVTGTGEPSFAETMRIFPNPTQDMLVLEFRQATLRSIELFDISGRSIRKLKASSLEERLDISKLSAGMYVVEVIQGAKKTSYRILKQ